jgi:signal transduction histidine kinase
VSEAAALHQQALDLASATAAASRRLSRVLEEKDRVSRLLDVVLESLDTAVAIVRHDGVVLAANRASRRLGTVLQTDQCLSLHPELEGGTTDASDRIVRPAADDRSIWMVRSRPLDIPEGPAARLIVVTDVSWLVRLENRERRRSRLEAAGRMAVELAHEVRNPLGSLELFASMLLDDLAHAPRQHEMATQVLAGVRRLSTIVSRLLQAVRGRGVKLEECVVDELAQGAIRFLEPLALSREITLALRAGPRSVTAMLDREALHQVLLNLVGNSLAVTPAGGRIEVRVTDNNNELSIEVHDTGPGIAPAIRERIFDALFTTRDEGTGLGLAIVERIAIEHGGHAEAGESDLGGACLRIVIPKTAAKLEQRSGE